jgi:hypothetical protein
MSAFGVKRDIGLIAGFQKANSGSRPRLCIAATPPYICGLMLLRERTRPGLRDHRLICKTPPAGPRIDLERF